MVKKCFPLLLQAAKIMWFSSITQVKGVIERFGLRRYALFSDALKMIWRNKKLVTKCFPLLRLAAKVMWISSITQVIDVKVQFGLRRYASFSDALTIRWDEEITKRKKWWQKCFHFYCWQQILVHNSGNRCDRTVRIAALCIVFRCAYNEMEK